MKEFIFQKKWSGEQRKNAAPLQTIILSCHGEELNIAMVFVSLNRFV